MMASLEAQGMAELYRTIENPLVVVLAKMEHVGIAVDVAELEALGARLSAEVDTLGAELRVGRRSRRPEPQLAEAAARDPLRRARSQPGQEDQDRLLDRRRHAGEDQGPVARVPRPADALSRGREAAQHVRRGPARRGRRRRSHPRHVQPDRRPHRPAVVRSAEPAQHPGAHRRGAPVPAGVRPGRGHHAARGRLQPDRAALHRPPRHRSRPDRGVHERAGHPQRDRRPGVLASTRRRSRSNSGRRRRWSRTVWPTAWRPTGSGSG